MALLVEFRPDDLLPVNLGDPVAPVGEVHHVATIDEPSEDAAYRSSRNVSVAVEQANGVPHSERALVLACHIESNDSYESARPNEALGNKRAMESAAALSSPPGPNTGPTHEQGSTAL